MHKSYESRPSLKKRLLRALEKVKPHVNLRGSDIKVVIITKANIEAVARRFKIPDITAWHGTISSCSSVGNTYYLFYNKHVWAAAPQEALIGNIAHELVHREFLELNPNWYMKEGVFPPDYFRPCNNSNAVFSESLVDLVVMHKGFKNETYKWKHYLETTHTSFIGLCSTTTTSLLKQAEYLEEYYGWIK